MADGSQGKREPKLFSPAQVVAEDEDGETGAEAEQPVRWKRKRFRIQGPSRRVEARGGPC